MTYRRDARMRNSIRSGSPVSPRAAAFGTSPARANASIASSMLPTIRATSDRRGNDEMARATRRLLGTDSRFSDYLKLAMHPANVKRYGRDKCRAKITSRIEAILRLSTFFSSRKHLVNSEC